MSLEALTFVVAVVAGAVASITGFGIGSLLTPLLAAPLGTSLAVAAVSVPHLVGTGLRFRLLGVAPDRQVLRTFGVASALGSLTGALLQAATSAQWLTLVFGAVLTLTSASELLGWARAALRGPTAIAAGAASGLLGGLVGNQGGIRSAALLGFDLRRDVFVATATAVGLVVDGARMPLYVWRHHAALPGVAGLVAIAVTGVVVGTVLGGRLLGHVPEHRFRQVVALVVGALGVLMLARGLGAL